MTNHTPGPWVVVPGGDHYAHIVGTDGRPISVINRGNAALIAAAPDLYKALGQLLDDMGEDGLSVRQAAKDQARAALTKARGTH